MNPNRIGAPEHLFRSASTPISRVTTSFEGVESMTRQDQAEACNINNIYRKTQQGQLSLMSNKAPTFGDFSDVGTYDTILESINEANEAFMALPSEVRKLYNNDPEMYYEKVTEGAIADAKEKAELARLATAFQEEQNELTKAKSLVAKHAKTTDSD